MDKTSAAYTQAPRNKVCVLPSLRITATPADWILAGRDKVCRDAGHLRNPSFWIVSRYRSRLFRARYLSNAERLPTIFSRPRRDEWSFL